MFRCASQRIAFASARRFLLAAPFVLAYCGSSIPSLSDEVVQAPGYCPSIYTNCIDGCGAYPDRIKDVRLHRVGDHFQLVVIARAYPEKYCDPSTCNAQHGDMIARAWIDWAGDRAWGSEDLVLDKRSSAHLTIACQDTVVFSTDVTIPASGPLRVADTTWMRAQVYMDEGDLFGPDPCIRFGKCLDNDGSGALSTLDRKIRLDRPAVVSISCSGRRTRIFGISNPIWQTTLGGAACNLGTPSGGRVIASLYGC